MATVIGVPTEDGRKYILRSLGKFFDAAATTNVGLNDWNWQFSHFKVGEGGWVDPGGGKEPRTPANDIRRQSAPLIQDLDAAVDSTRPLIDQRYPTDSRAVFLKALSPSDITFPSDFVMSISCLLDFSDFNDDGFGNDPEIWEIGIFADHPTESGQKLLVAYGTFPMQVKSSGIQIINTVKITL